uniref:large ribosomal subunit protein mL53 n=1 Tax=Monopterus albus TaxID=43700 RepID=UPI0009B317E7|nr:39S ribosomal protein L53, mitochondrial [Monopterus albus]
MAASRTAPVVLKAVKKIAINFCPFESNVRSTREFLALVGSEKARGLFQECGFVETQFTLLLLVLLIQDKSRITSDCGFMSHLTVSFSFSDTVDGDRLVMKGANLTSREMLSAFQSRCIDKDPQTKAAMKK